MEMQKKVQEYLQDSSIVYSASKAVGNPSSHPLDMALYIWEDCWGQQLSAP